jgi:hypothetical protein
MKIIQLIDEDFVNYKVPSMVIGFPHCDFKCDKLCGKNVCQNSELIKYEPIEISAERIVDRYVNNSISKALVCQGLEPFDDFEDLKNLITAFIEKSEDDIVIYTGYEENEVYNYTQLLKIILNNADAKNKLIVKFGRYIPGYKSHFDSVLGVNLASYNQYAIVLH